MASLFFHVDAGTMDYIVMFNKQIILLRLNFAFASGSLMGSERLFLSTGDWDVGLGL